MISFDEFKNVLVREGIDFDSDVDLSSYSYFKRGGHVRYLVRPANVTELKTCANYLAGSEISYKLIGATTNILFLDNLDHSVFISLRRVNGFIYDEEKGIVTAEAGLMLPAFVNKLVDLEMEGFEGLEGIPGTIGGAVYMNAGAFHCEIQDNLIDVNILQPDGSIACLTKEEMKFSFRHSALQDDLTGVVVSARFRVKKGQADEIRGKVAKYREFRRTYLESKLPNLGSIFATYDIYADIARQHLVYRICIRLLRYIFYKWRSRPPTDMRILNRFTAWYFGWKFSRQPYSDKTLNCLVNNGCSTDELVNYIEIIEDLTDGRIRVENEIVRDVTAAE